MSEKTETMHLKTWQRAREKIGSNGADRARKKYYRPGAARSPSKILNDAGEKLVGTDAVSVHGRKTFEIMMSDSRHISVASSL